MQVAVMGTLQHTSGCIFTGMLLKERFTPKKGTFGHYLLTPMAKVLQPTEHFRGATGKAVLQRSLKWLQ